MGEITLLPLLPFTKGGRSREVLTRMFRLIEQDTTLDEASKREVALIGFTFASLLLQRAQSPELDWLIRRFQDMHVHDLTELAQQQVEQMGSEEILNDVLMKIIMAQSQEEAKEALLHWQENIQ